MIAQQHKVARAPEGIHAATGIRHDQRAGAERVQHAHRESDLLQVVAFVPVKPALHGHDGTPAQTAEQQAAGVSLDRGERKARDLGVRHLGLDRDLAREPAQAGPENDPDLRHERAPTAHHPGRGLHSIVQRHRHRHVRSPNSRVPILIIVAPSSTATGKSPDMPMDSSGSR